MALKLKFVKACGYETYDTKEVKTEHKGEAKVDMETEEEQQAPDLLDIHVNYVLHSIFSNVDVYINSQQIYNSNELYAHKS